MTKPNERAEMDWTGAVLLGIEMIFLGVLLVGLWWVFPPAALIVGGALGVYGMERTLAAHARRLAAEQAEKVRRIGRAA